MIVTPKISIVVPTYGRIQTLPRTVPTILAQDFPPDEFEVLIIDDGSTDGTAEFLRGLKSPCPYYVISQPHRGPSAARNAGIRAARGEIILFLDDDMICSPDLLRQHCAAHAGKERHLVHGRVYVAQDSPPSLIRYGTEAWYKAYYERLAAHGGLHLPSDAFLISNCSLPRDVLLACKGFDETIPSKEDSELGLRLWKAGIRFCYLPNAVAYELFVKSSRDYVAIDGAACGRSEVILCRMYPEYRLHSGLSLLADSSWWTRVLRCLAIQSPISPAVFLRAPLRIAERLHRRTKVRNAGVKVLQLSHRVSFLRAAAKELGSFEALQQQFAHNMPVLLYHHVGPLQPRTYASLTISPRMFERQIRWLARRGYSGIRLEDWIAWSRGGRALPKRPVLITLDDAYADVSKYALPVLRDYGFSSTVFVVSGLIGGTNAWDEAAGCGTHRLMTAEDIRKWAAQGVDFGVHSRTHADLRLLSGQQLEEEVRGSAEDLTRVLGRRPTAFAYPFGYYNDNVSQCVSSAFDAAFTCEEGLNTMRTDLYRLRRVAVSPDDSVLEFACRVKHGWSAIERLRRKLRPRARLRSVLTRLR